MIAVYSLPFAAHFLVKTGSIEQGLELWELAKTQPSIANSTWFADVAGRELEAMAAALPPEVVEVAGERGRTLGLWATAESLRAKLG